MRKTIVIISYPESGWGIDLVEFDVPNHFKDYQITDAIRSAREQLTMADFATPQDMMDHALNAAASKLGGTWRYMPTAGEITVVEWEDADPTEWDSFEEEDDK